MAKNHKSSKPGGNYNVEGKSVNERMSQVSDQTLADIKVVGQSPKNLMLVLLLGRRRGFETT